jgi:hypothetical protein
MKTGRRGFLKQSSATAAGLMLGKALKAQDSATGTSRYTLTNDKLRVEFDGRGMVSIDDFALGSKLPIKTDRFTLTLNQELIDSAQLLVAAARAEAGSVTYTFRAASWKFEIVYELRSGWRFVSKQILVDGLPEDSFRVDRAEPLQLAVGDEISELSPHEVFIAR